MIKGVLCSSGALITRLNGRDPKKLRELFPYSAADGLEFMIYPAWDGRLDDVAEIVSAFSRDTGVKIPVIHADKHIGELLSQGAPEEIEEAFLRFRLGCRVAEKLGASLMVLHLWGGPASDRNIGRNISALGELTEEAAKHGVLLTVENVVCGGKTPLAHIRTIIERYPDAAFTVDTKMAEFHRELPETVACEELWKRTKHLHVNDYGGGVRDFSDLRVLHIGEGHVDFEPFFNKVRSSGYDGWATVEATSVLPDGSVDQGKLERSLNAVRKALK